MNATSAEATTNRRGGLSEDQAAGLDGVPSKETIDRIASFHGGEFRVLSLYMAIDADADARNVIRTKARAETARDTSLRIWQMGPLGAPRFAGRGETKGAGSARAPCDATPGGRTDRRDDRALSGDVRDCDGRRR